MAEVIRCAGCGSSNIYITNDGSTPVMLCKQCGGRYRLTADAGLDFSHTNAIRFFAGQMLPTAVHFARDALKIAPGDIPANYILAYDAEFQQKQNGSLKAFFSSAQEQVLLREEAAELMKLFLTYEKKLTVYEQDVLLLLTKDPQCDRESLKEFTNAFCSAQIVRRSNVDFLNEEMKQLYIFLIAECEAYRICTTLLAAIKGNGGSPYHGDNFFQEKRTQYFYEHFVLPVGEIISSISNDPYRMWFEDRYQQEKQQYLQLAEDGSRQNCGKGGACASA